MKNYSPKVQKALTGISVGDKIEIKRGKFVKQGVVLPRIEIGDKNCIVLKLDNGYNVGIKYQKGVQIKKLKGGKVKKLGKVNSKFKTEHDPDKPTISIIGTGGTIASRVDYKTGGVVPVSSAEDIVASIPELAEIANLKCRVIMEKFSEDLDFSNYELIAKEVAKEIEKGCDGVIITHGTDTLHYTSAALSFAIQKTPVPVILVGAQRSSDRGSSDAGFNMICAAKFIRDSDFSGIGVCMHGSISDNYCTIHPGVKTRKLHTSRRDAFQSVNSNPYARIWENGKIDIMREYPTSHGLKVNEKFNHNVGLLKVYPGISSEVLKAFKKMDGLVIEGTGLGHAPINNNEEFMKTLKSISKKIPVVMTSQCIWGRVNMNVYATGRVLQEMGVIPGEDMLPEVAMIKLSWLLANEPKNTKDLVGQNLVGEITERTEIC